MIVKEFLQDGKFVRNYSDAGKMILQIETGIEYSDAIDLATCDYTYKEVTNNIESNKNDNITQKNDFWDLNLYF